MLGHKDVQMTMIYTHLLNRGGWGGEKSTRSMRKSGADTYGLTSLDTTMTLPGSWRRLR
ncbi:hypothetical protein [Microcoleus sp. Pol11C3]|uniref:hypothetical protein n=1 Tax=Microcoleus sp. Pol11C3 TaxID=3055390 RepID=UPI0040409DFB